MYRPRYHRRPTVVAAASSPPLGGLAGTLQAAGVTNFWAPTQQGYNDAIGDRDLVAWDGQAPSLVSGNTWQFDHSQALVYLGSLGYITDLALFYVGRVSNTSSERRCLHFGSWDAEGGKMMALAADRSIRFNNGNRTHSGDMVSQQIYTVRVPPSGVYGDIRLHIAGIEIAGGGSGSSNVLGVDPGSECIVVGAGASGNNSVTSAGGTKPALIQAVCILPTSNAANMNAVGQALAAEYGRNWTDIPS